MNFHDPATIFILVVASCSLSDAAPPGSSMEHAHQLKTWPFSFQAILDGAKTFEVRKDDRGYLAGDWLLLREYEPEKASYTGRFVMRQVTFILRGPGWGIEDGHVVMALRGE